MKLTNLVVALAVYLGAAPPAQAAPVLANYGRLPVIEFVRLSASGDRIAFIAFDGTHRRLFVRRVGGEALLSPEVGDAKIRDIQWAGEDFVLLTTSSTTRYGDGITTKWSYNTRLELPQVTVFNLKTGTSSVIFDRGNATLLRGVVDGNYGVRNLGGQWFGYYTAIDSIGLEDLFKVDLSTGNATTLTGTLGRGQQYFVADDGKIQGRAHYDDRTSEWKLYAGAKGSQTLATKISRFNTASLEGQGRTTGTVIVTDQSLRGDTVEEITIADTPTSTPLFVGRSVEQLLQDRRTGYLIGAILEGADRGIFFDPALQRRFDGAMKAFPGLQTALVSYSTDLLRMIVETDGGADPGTYWLVDMTSGKATELSGAYPALDASDVGPTRYFEYSAGDGQKLEGVLTLPSGVISKNLPLVVMPHGGPMGVRDKVGFNWWAQAFASRGYAVFQPNYRGSSGYGAAFRDAGLGQWGKKMLWDINEGVAALAAEKIIDPRRTCVVGASYGGYVALAEVTIMVDHYRCAVAVAPVTDVGAMMLRWGDSALDAGGRYNRALFGATSAIDPVLHAMSPLAFARNASAPILLIHGRDDTVVPYVHSSTMQGALRAAGKTVEFVTLDSEDHWLSHEKTRRQTLEASVAFVEKYNPAK